MAYWPAIRGTPLCIVNGVNDARPGVRWHYTDVQYGRLTDQILARQQLDHVYLEHNGQHGFPYGRKNVFDYLRSARDLRRDPFYDHVGLASPAGYRQSYSYHGEGQSLAVARRYRQGRIAYEELVPHDDGTFASWRLEYRKTMHRGAPSMPSTATTTRSPSPRETSPGLPSGCIPAWSMLPGP